MDNEFEVLRPQLDILVITLNEMASKEHAPTVDHQIRAVKKSVRPIWNSLSFNCYHFPMISQMVSYAILWLNTLPEMSGVSNNLSPRTIMNEITIDYNKHCKLKFRAYAEIKKDPATSNSMAAHSEPEICLRPTGNLQGTYFFLSLCT